MEERVQNPCNARLCGVEIANVRKPGWLCELELDYCQRGWDRYYHIDVLAALPEGGVRLRESLLDAFTRQAAAL